MADLPVPWRTYARLQTQVSGSRRLTSLTWGAEAGLDFILASASHTPPTPEEVGRTVAGAARRERHRAGLRAAHFGHEDTILDAEDRCHARQRLRVIEASTDSTDLELLYAVAAGNGYSELAAAGHGTEGALRVRVLRLRRRLVGAEAGR